jgi:DNA (cytosine-5)-methyltransferase 1
MKSLPVRGCPATGSELRGGEAADDATQDHWRKCTVFDCCSGAGGVSCGASRAGFDVPYALDVWDTYKANHPQTALFQMPMGEFVSSQSPDGMMVDVLHYSPPAHTRDSVQDNANISALYGLGGLITMLGPRIITVEQTFGITRKGHASYFHNFLADLTKYGYSFCFKVINLADLGVPQRHRRVLSIMHTACDGQIASEFQVTLSKDRA